MNSGAPRLASEATQGVATVARDECDVCPCDPQKLDPSESPTSSFAPRLCRKTLGLEPTEQVSSSGASVDRCSLWLSRPESEGTAQDKPT
jgi:hypothetical protein